MATNLERTGTARPADGVWVLRFAYPNNPLPMNGAKGAWRARARKTREVRELASFLARSARIPTLGHCTAQVTWWVANNRTRDVDNLAAFEKAVFDGLVDAGVVPDDSPRFMNKPRGTIRHVTDSDGLVTQPCFTVTITRAGA